MFQITVADIYFEIVNMNTVSTLFQSIIEYFQSNFQLSSLWSSLNLNDNNYSKSLTFFCVNMHNIVNFQIESNVMWRFRYLDSENFVWNDDYECKEAVNLYMIN